MTSFITSSHFVDHDTGPSHPERPDRIRAIALAVRQAGLMYSSIPLPNFHLDLRPMHAVSRKLHELPEPALADEKWLRLVHPQQYIEHVRHICEIGGGVLDQGDTPVSEHSFEIARLAAGALLNSCDAVVSGKAQRAF